MVSVPLPAGDRTISSEAALTQPSHDESCVMDPATADNPYKRILARAQRERRLLSVHWELTYRCNERCAHCYLDVLPPGAKVPGELTTEECKRVIDELAAEGALFITFSGGEPLVRSDFFEIAEYARKKRFAVRVFTNGTLITEQLADRIATLHPVMVEMSVYGAEPETHDSITLIPGSWTRTIRAFHLLHERGVKTLLKTPFMHDNVHEFYKLRVLAKELGAGFRHGTVITTKDSGERSTLRYRLTDKDLLWLFRKEIRTNDWQARVINESEQICGIAGFGMVIGATGEVFSCMGARVLIGNLRCQPLGTLWRESPIWAQLQKLTLGALPECSSCKLLQYCWRCHGLAKIEDGDILGCSSIARREALLRRKVIMEKKGGSSHA